ncbi:MAG: hypothetical protein J3K34DRAFT_522208 [Monoraphidium minutum]|nr:MAG: hypothetical protein J3K34DRAFT_522208 [Monoraphidium minutum]
MAAPAASSPEPLNESLKSPGRAMARDKKPSGYSYAAIGLLKDNLQAAKKGVEQGRLDDYLLSSTSSLLSTASTVTMAAAIANKGALHTGGAASVAQRTGLSKENALLRAEVEVLRQQVSELAGRLKASEGRAAGQLGGASGPHGAGGAPAGGGGPGGGGGGKAKGEAEKEVEAVRALLERSEGVKAHAIAEAEAALSQLEEARSALDPLLLGPEEVEALALSCCWLARYWGLAAAFGIYPEVAAANAAHWGALAPPPSAMLDAARRAAGGGGGGTRPDARRQPPDDAAGGSGRGGGGGGEPGGTEQLAEWWVQRRRQQQGQAAAAAGPPGPAGAAARARRRPPPGDGGDGEEAAAQLDQEASAADAAGVELALRQLGELGVEGAVMAALAEQARSRRAVVQLPAAGAAPEGLTPVSLSPEEAEEVSFQAARLAALWGAAAGAGAEPALARERAEYWAWRAERGRPSLRDFTDLRRGFQELRMRGAEQQVWEARRQAAAAAVAEARAAAAAHA